jgi:TPP-dependent pyruvate/acetoin dehydrogenase alpha subunit
MRGRMIAEGHLTAEQAAEIESAAREEMEAAVQFGLDSPFPEPDAATAYVYA